MVDLKIKLPEGFLDEEIRYGYTVSKQMKEVWAVELDLLAEIQRVCEKYHLKYFADAGTLLGTVRDKGFIPWDDDIDLCMFREDYDKLIAVADIEFKSPYKFQSYHTEKNYPRGHAQFRNTRTTCILNVEKADYNVQFNQGIFLDIFVLDGVPNNEKQLNALGQKLAIYKKLLDYKTGYRIPTTNKGHVAEFLIKALPVPHLVYAGKIDKLLKQTRIEDVEVVAPLNFIFETKKRARNKHLYDETVWLPFEFMNIPCPAGYDEFLTKRDGDYMKPSQIPTTHGGSILDADHPDCYYLQGKQ